MDNISLILIQINIQREKVTHERPYHATQHSGLKLKELPLRKTLNYSKSLEFGVIYARPKACTGLIILSGPQWLGTK